jgi:hypothetical protein
VDTRTVTETTTEITSVVLHPKDETVVLIIVTKRVGNLLIADLKMGLGTMRRIRRDITTFSRWLWQLLRDVGMNIWIYHLRLSEFRVSTCTGAEKALVVSFDCPFISLLFLLFTAASLTGMFDAHRHQL